ncbi:hypothetical protein GCM10022254_11730 [Actinomadura meridiana]|uniref:Uncharacterized protein n=1 Tax=Actinomadura meridiana TaxID=559626 RepID=A0ABP8BUF9_9ACTN
MRPRPGYPECVHGCAHLRTLEELTDAEQEVGRPDARDQLESAIHAGLVGAFVL